MTTNIIDGALGVGAFPATYTGPGTLIGNIRRPANVDSDVYGYFTSNGNATQINVGFTAREVRIVNWTDGIEWEWIFGGPAANAIKNTFGTGFSIDTTSQITISPKEDQLLGGNVVSGGNANVTLGATLCGTGKLISFEIHG